MDLFVAFCLEKYQNYHLVNIVGSPVMVHEFEVGQSYLLFVVYTDRESSDSIPTQVLYKPEKRVKKVIYESSKTRHEHRFREQEDSNKYVDITPEDLVSDDENTLYYVIYRYTEDYVCK